MSWCKRLGILIIGMLLTLRGELSFAQALSETWMSVRAMGMGNAYTAVVDDSDSLFYNPAGLARISGFHWTVFDVHAGINGIETVNEIQKLTTATSDNLAENIKSLYGKQIWLGGGGKSVLTLPGFAAGYYASANGEVYMANPANPTLNTNYFFDYGIAVGGAFDFIPEIFKVGVVARRLNRTGTTLPLGPAVLAELDTTALEGEFKRRGTGYGFDFGAVITIPGPVSPTLSFVYKDIGGVAFTHEEGIGAPPSIESEMIIGAAFKIDTPIITITPSVDYKHANRSDLQLGKKLHAGVEIDLPLIDLRAGLNQGYYTLGAGLSLGIIRFDVATYGVELGAYPGQHEDRRYVAQVTFELGFDPSKFGFGGVFGGGKSGERRHLKRRR